MKQTIGQTSAGQQTSQRLSKQTVAAQVKSLDQSLLSSIQMLHDKKVSDLLYIDIADVHTYFEGFLVGTASSELHLASLSHSVIKNLKGKRVSREEIESGWVCISLFPYVLHLLVSEQREKYNFERLWGDGHIIHLHSDSFAE